jgi:hypothetical protein
MNTIRITVPLTRDEAKSLINLAKIERRHPRDQAAYLLGKLLACQQSAPAVGGDKKSEVTGGLPCAN